MAKQSIDPALLALQTAKKAMPSSPSTQAVVKPSLNVKKQQTQAISTNITPPVSKIGGISSPFGATNINSSVMGGATPQEIGTRAKELQSLPKAMPATGSEPVKKLSIDDFAMKIKEKYPEYKDKDNKILAEAMIKKYPEYKDKVAIDNGNFITDLGSGIGQSVAGFGNLGKKLAFGAVDLYRQSQGKEKLTPEQRASAEQTPMGQALNTITNRQTPEEKASVGGQIGMVAGSVAQGAALGTPLTNALGKIPGVAQIATKAPVLSKIVGGVAQGLEGQLQYSAAAEGKLPTSKELLTAGAFGGSVNAIGPIAKGIKENIKLPKITTPTVASKADDRANQMLTNMNRITKGEQEKFAVQQGKTVGQFLNDKGIVSGGEKTIEKVAKGFIESKNKADEGLALIKGNYKNEYLSTMANEAAEFAENTLSPEASKIRALAQKADDIGLTMSESNIIKRFYERNNKFTYGRDITAGEKTVRATNLDNYVRNRQMEIADQNGLSNLREINKDTQGFKYILDKLVKNEDGRLGNNAIGLTDWIVAGEVASNPSAIGLLVGKKIASSNRFRSGVVKILNRLSGHTNEADKILDIGRIMQIQNEKDLNKFLALPLKKNVPTPSIPLNSNRGIQGMVKGTNVVVPPKPTPKTPPITVEKGAIGMGTPKANNTPVIPPKATVAPSVSTPKKGMPKLGKETLEQNLYHGTKYDFDTFDVKRSYSDRNNILGAGDAIYFSESKDIADKYTRANANEYLHKSVIDEVTDPVAKKLLKGLVNDGFDKGRQSLTKDEISLMNAKGIDGNDINDLSERIRGSQSVKKEGTNLLTMDNKIEIPDNILKIAKRLGIKTLPGKPRIMSVSLESNAKIKNIGQVSDIQKATAQAKKEGYDGVKFTTSNSIGGEPEIAVWNTSVIKKSLPPLPKKGLPKLGKETLEQNINNNDLEKVFEYTKSGAGEKVMPLSRQKEVSKSLSSFPKNKEKVYAGLTLDSDFIYDNLYDGGVFESKRLLSSSTDRNIAESFMDYNEKGLNKVLLEIDGGGSDISSVSRYGEKSLQGEKEILFPIGSKFKVEKVDDGYYKLKFIEKKPLPPLPKKGK